MQLVHYVVALVVIALGDWAWIGTQKDMNRSATESVQGSEMRVRLGGAAAAYVCLYGLLVLHAVPHVIDDVRSRGVPVWLAALWHGGTQGLLAYGLYNFTNYAVLERYPLGVALADTAWGGVLATLVCLAAASWPRAVTDTS